MNRRHLPLVDAGELLVKATAGAQENLDAAVAQRLANVAAAGKTVPCRKGCAACCYFPIEVQLLDVWQIVAHLRDWSPAELGRVRRRLTDAMARAKHARLNLARMFASKKGRVRYTEARIACPFLVEGEDACRIYAVRPSACRTHYVVDTDPVECANPRSAAGFDYLNLRGLTRLFFEEIWAVLPDAMTVYGTCNLLLGLHSAWDLIEHPEITLDAWLARPVPRAAAQHLFDAMSGGMPADADPYRSNERASAAGGVIEGELEEPGR
jgi:Fe-S-cluster containining protein